jgi:light-regulated signal transduction histidine kinase (bacteriophytochrome)
MIVQVDVLTTGLEALVHERTKELDRLNGELQRSNTDLDRFAHTVSHDLQAPLRNVTLIVQQLKEDFTGRVPEELLKRIDEIDQQCDREMKMVQRILFISRLGRGEFQQQPVDLHATLHQILSGMRASLDERGVIVDIPEHLPTVAGDGILLGEVLRNLVSNAAKYNDKPEKRVRVVARVFPEHGTTVFAVQDNGIGIKPQHLKKVFDLFTPLHDKRKFSETIGAGMAITRRIVERHRGKIRVVSVFGQGTSFFVRLPTEGIARPEFATTESIRMGSISLRALQTTSISRH